MADVSAFTAGSQRDASSRIFVETRNSQLLRTFSEVANNSVKSAIGAKMGPGTATIFILNSLTGLSLLTLPYGFNQAGLLLGATILLVCMLMAFVTATFMCEALTIANALAYEDAEVKALEEKPEVLSSLRQAKESTRSDERLQERLLKKGGRHSTVDMFLEEARRKNADREFKIRERVELGAMGELVLKGVSGKRESTLIYLMVLTFTYGTATALVVTVNKSLASTVCSALDLAEAPMQCEEGSQILIYKGCVVATFFLTLPLCFADLQKTKKFTLGIMVMRFIAIACLLCVSSVIAVRRVRVEGLHEVVGQLPLWNLGEFTAVFGNAVFLFGIHHYVPSMIAPLEPQRLAPRVIITAFVTCYVLILAVCFTAMVAWGGETHQRCSTHPGGHFCTIQPIYNLNFAPLGLGGGAMGLFLVTYPAMAIASIPIAAITTRNTMCRWLGVPSADPEHPYTASNIGMTFIVLLPPFTIAFFTQNVQAVIQYVGGYAGLTVAMLCPLELVRLGRRKLRQSKLERDSSPAAKSGDSDGDDDGDRPLKSPFAGPCGYLAVLAFYLASLALVTRKLFFS